jgi:hypothetical protein
MFFISKMLYETQIYYGKGIFKGMKLLIAHSHLWSYNLGLVSYTKEKMAHRSALHFLVIKFGLQSTK